MLGITLASLKSIFGTWLGFFLARSLLLSASSSLWPNDHVAACSTGHRSATEKNEMGGYVTVPCSSEMTQRSSRVDWVKF